MAGERWQTPPADLSLEKDEIHLWQVRVTEHSIPGGPADLPLSTAERERANRFYFDRDRNRYIVSRVSLRTILGRYLGLPPADLQFGHGTQGKPNLDPVPERSGLSFNLSHSGDLVLIAVGREREIGVDVEKIRPGIDLEGISRRFFSPGEQASLFALPESQRPAAFFRCWTRKEAYIKARGGGLSIPLGQFDVTLDPEVPAALLETRDDPGEAARWSLHNIEVRGDYQAALAVEGTPTRISYWRYVPRRPSPRE